MGIAVTLFYKAFAPVLGYAAFFIRRGLSTSDRLCCWCSREGSILWASKAFKEHFDVTEGLSLWPLLSTFDIDGQGLHKFQESIKKSTFERNREPCVWITKVFSFFTVLNKSGRTFWIKALSNRNCVQNAHESPLNLDVSSLDRSSLLVVELDTEARICYANPAFWDFQKRLSVHMALESMPFRHVLVSLTEQVRSSKRCIHKQFSETVLGERYVFDCVAFLSAQGRVICYGREVPDIFEEMPSFQKRKRCAERLFRNLPMGVAIFDQNQKLSSFNHHFSGMFRLDEVWLNTGPLWGEVLDCFRERRILPEVLDFSSYKDQFTALFQNIERSPHEEFIHLANECTIRMVLVPHPFSGCVVFFEDVTEKMRLKRRRHEMSLLLNTVANQSDQGLLVLNSEKRVFLLNQAFQRLWGLGADFKTLKDKNISALFEDVKDHFYSPVHRRFFQQALSQSLSNRLARSAFVLCKNSRVLHAHYAPLPNGEHLLKFSDMTSEFERYEVKRESSRLLSLERIVFSARLNGLVKSIEHQSVYESDLGSLSQGTHEAKWVSAQFLSEAVKDVRRSFSEDHAFLRDSFSFSDVLDEVLSLFDGLLTERKLKLQLLGTFDVSFVMNRTLFFQFLWRAIGYAFYEALPGSLVTLFLKRSKEGVALHVTSHASDKESWAPHMGVVEHMFRPWALGFSLLSRFAARVNCKLHVSSFHKKCLRFTCYFSKQSIEVFMETPFKQAS